MPEIERAIRTMKSDADELVKKEQSSFIDLVAEQAKARERGGPSGPPIRIGPAHKKSRAKIIFTVVTVILLAAGGGSAYFFLSKEEGVEPKPIVRPGPEIPRPTINAQKTSAITIQEDDRTGLLSEMSGGLLRSRNDTNFWYLPVLVTNSGRDTHIATPRELFQTLRISVPSEDFWGGIENTFNLYVYGEDFIFIFPVRQEPKVKGAMLAWERILPQQFATIIRGAGASPRTFEDKIIKNIDVRIAQFSETQGRAVAWAVVSGKFLALATSEAAIRAVIDRLVGE